MEPSGPALISLCLFVCFLCSSSVGSQGFHRISLDEFVSLKIYLSKDDQRKTTVTKGTFRWESVTFCGTDARVLFLLWARFFLSYVCARRRRLRVSCFSLRFMHELAAR